MAIKYPQESTTPNPQDLQINYNLYTNGNLGIGTTSASLAVDCVGRGRIKGTSLSGGGGFWCTKESSPTANSSFVGRGTDAEGFVGFWNGSWKLIVQDVNNRVGIGTTRPNTELEVNGTVQCDGLRIDQSASPGASDCTHYFPIYLNSSTPTYYIPCYE